MKLEQVYDGRFFPCYYYEPNAITVAVTSKAEPEDTEHITWLFLPMVQEEIDRALQRAGIADPADVRLRLEDTQLPDEVDVLLDMEQENLADLNALAQAADELSSDDMKKLGAVITLAKPQNAEQIKNLVENLDLFDFAPGAHKMCIRDSPYPVSARQLRHGGYGRDDGADHAEHSSRHYFLSMLPEAHHQGRRRRRGQGLSPDTPFSKISESR